MTKFIQALIASFITLFFSFNPIIQLSFGMAAAGISGYIEYQILSDLFPNTEFILYLVVIVETLKLILIFNYGKGDVSRSNSLAGVLRLGFIILSIYCSSLFCLYKLNAPEAESFVSMESQRLDKQEDKELAWISGEYSNLIEVQTAKMNRRLDELFEKREEEKDNTYKGSTEYEGPKYKGYSKEIVELQAEISKVETAILLDKKIEIKAIKGKTDSLRNIINVSSNSNLKTGSKVLTASLRVFNGGKDFDESSYIINILFISFLLVFIIEGLIYYTFCNLAEDYGEILKLNLNGYKNNKKGKSIKDDLNGIYGSTKSNNSGYMNFKMKDIYTRIKNYNESTIKEIKDFFNTKN